jgi:C4-dicarboxylate-specific signal transduction histidine kinase
LPFLWFFQGLMSCRDRAPGASTELRNHVFLPFSTSVA